MAETTNLLGIELPSNSPVFLTMVGVHVLVGLACVVTGAVAMLSQKRKGRHPTFGTIYDWCLTAVFISATGLAPARWTEDYHLFLFGTLSFASASVGRIAMRRRWHGWINLHVSGMGISYILLLTAFYVDNGKSLPIWKHLPPIVYWTFPAAVGLPIMSWAFLRHPLARRSRAQPFVRR
jgi:hypothetical protein